MATAIMSSVPAAQTGEATSVNTIARTGRSSIGTAGVAGVLAAHTSDLGIPSDQAFTTGFWVCSAVAVLAVGAALALPSSPKTGADE